MTNINLSCLDCSKINGSIYETEYHLKRSIENINRFSGTFASTYLEFSLSLISYCPEWLSWQVRRFLFCVKGLLLTPKRSQCQFGIHDITLRNQLASKEFAKREISGTHVWWSIHKDVQGNIRPFILFLLWAFRNERLFWGPLFFICHMHSRIRLRYEFHSIVLLFSEMPWTVV